MNLLLEEVQILLFWLNLDNPFFFTDVSFLPSLGTFTAALNVLLVIFLKRDTLPTLDNIDLLLLHGLNYYTYSLFQQKNKRMWVKLEKQTQWCQSVSLTLGKKVNKYQTIPLIGLIKFEHQHLVYKKETSTYYDDDFGCKSWCLPDPSARCAGFSPGLTWRSGPSAFSPFVAEKPGCWSSLCMDKFRIHTLNTAI